VSRRVVVAAALALFAAVGIAVWAVVRLHGDDTMAGRAAPKQSSVPFVERIGAFAALPPLDRAARVSAARKFGDLTTPVRTVDPATIRQPIPGVLLARRKDGLACMVTHTFGGCFSNASPDAIVMPSARRVYGPKRDVWELTTDGLVADGIPRVDLIVHQPNGDMTLPVSVRGNVFSSRVVGPSAYLVGYRIGSELHRLPPPPPKTR
jgi:hypothetical protein